MRTAVALRHVAFEDLGLIEPWLKRRGWRVEYHEVGVDDWSNIDDVDVDLLVVLGGPIGAEDDDTYPYLEGEVRLIRQRIDSRRPVLGICLGAQLMARALGASVRAMATTEIGYSPVTITREGAGSPLAHLSRQAVLHWHGDQFALPEGVPSLASTSACPHQAFMVDNYAMALQFHLEVDSARIEQWLIGHTGELRHSAVDIPALRAEAVRQHEGVANALNAVMTEWFTRLQL